MQIATDKPTCRVPGCDSLIRNKKKRLCNAHWLRWTRYGRLRSVRRKKGEGTVSTSGYRLITIDGEQRYEHIVIAEKILGRRLGKSNQVHHLDKNPLNNAHDNLVICEDAEYHALLHTRQEALEATGNPNMRKCLRCSKWDIPKRMYKYRSHCKNGVRYSHAQQGYRCVPISQKLEAA